MKIQIIGVGVVGTAQAYLASYLGHEVFGYDPGKSSSPYAKMHKELQTDVDITFLCTPEAFIESSVEALVRNKVKGVYVIKSTVPAKTTDTLSQKFGVHISHNPEFLRESISLEDIINPHVVVIGQCCPEHANILNNFYQPLNRPIIITQPTVSETVKLSLNSYLATLITFWNQIHDLAKALGISTQEVASITKYNPRVSAYGTEFFGVPFGGKCLPKDLEQTIQVCQKAGFNPKFLQSVKDFNREINADRL
jgi:nucleotide sugar dehydrogenase